MYSATDFLTDFLTDLTDGSSATDFLTDLTDGWKFGNRFLNGFNGWMEETGSAGVQIVASATLALSAKKIKK